MQVYLVTLGKGLQGPSRMNGAVFLGENALYFLCASLGVTGGYDFAPFGPIGAALEDYKKTGTAPSIDEAALAALVGTVPNSFAIPPTRIETLSKTMCAGSKIVHDGGKKLVVWNPGFAGAFRTEAKAWALGKGITAQGL